MNEQQMMEFPETFEKFARDYGFKDDKEVYTNGSDLIPIFRVKQWLEHGNKLRTIETDTAYECGKHANKWIPVSETLPKVADCYAVTRQIGSDLIVDACYFDGVNTWHNDNRINHERNCLTNIVAWMPLPEPYKAENKDTEVQLDGQITLEEWLEDE